MTEIFIIKLSHLLIIARLSSQITFVAKIIKIKYVAIITRKNQ